MKLESIDGIDGPYGLRLREAGVRSPGSLLKKGATPAGRSEISRLSGIPDTLILKWVNHADLCRVRGIGPEFADLLEEAGVDTVRELSRRKPEKLHEALLGTNREQNLVRQMPSPLQLKDWIDQAKKLPGIVQY
jgi:predicted flap endonuclease-1-like 5' DNA nuclease